MDSDDRGQQIQRTETRWHHIAKSGAMITMLSKFFTGEVSVTVEDLAKEWSVWTLLEKQDFVTALSAAPVSDMRASLLDFLVECAESATTEDAWIFDDSASLLAHASNAARVRAWLMRRVELVPIGDASANIYHALALLGGGDVVALLMAHAEVYMKRLQDCASIEDCNVAADNCIAALCAVAIMDPSNAGVIDMLRKFQCYPDRDIAALAKCALRQTQPWFIEPPHPSEN